AAASCKGRRACRPCFALPDVRHVIGTIAARASSVAIHAFEQRRFQYVHARHKAGHGESRSLPFLCLPAYCITSLSSSTIGLTLAICSRSISRISAWLEPEGSAPTSVIRFCRSGCFAAAAISRCRRAMTGSGVPLGAKKPFQPRRSRLGKPSSRVLATSGSAAERLVTGGTVEQRLFRLPRIVHELLEIARGD